MSSISSSACCSAIEQVVRRFGDGLDAGMPDAALDGDGIEALAQAIRLSDAGDAVLRSQLRCDDGRRGEDPEADLAKRLEQGAVVELSEHPRPNASSGKPVIQRSAERGVLG